MTDKTNKEMHRREFLKRALAITAAVPFVGALVPKDALANELTTNELEDITAKLPTTIFDTRKLDTLVSKKFNNPRHTRNLIFLERTPIKNATDKELVESLERYRTQFFSADIVADDQESVIYDNIGSFEFAPSSIPNMKIGSKVSEFMLHRQASLIQGTMEEKELQFLNDWYDTLAESLAVGLRQRMNSLIISFITGGGNRYGNLIKFEGKENITVSKNWSHVKPLRTIKNHANYMKNVHGQKINRVTLGNKAFRQIIERDNISYSDNDISIARQKVANYLDMELEIYEGKFLERGYSGIAQKQRYLPDNQIILSNTENDNNPDVMYFGSAVTTESIVSDLVVDGNIRHGAIGYFTGDSELTDIRAWGVMRGIPVIKKPTAFTTINVEGVSL